MNEPNVVTRFRKCESPAALKDLGRQLADESLDSPQAIVHAWVTGDNVESEKAAVVALDLVETAIGAMLRESDSSPLEWRYRLMHAAVEDQWRLRSRVLSRLEALLASKDVLTASTQPASSETGTMPRRTCDEAYILIRSLLASENTTGSGAFSPVAFLEEADADKDTEIQRWLASETTKTLHEEP